MRTNNWFGKVSHKVFPVDDLLQHKGKRVECSTVKFAALQFLHPWLDPQHLRTAQLCDFPRHAIKQHILKRSQKNRPHCQFCVCALCGVMAALSCRSLSSPAWRDWAMWHWCVGMGPMTSEHSNMPTSVRHPVTLHCYIVICTQKLDMYAQTHHGPWSKMI